MDSLEDWLKILRDGEHSRAISPERWLHPYYFFSLLLVGSLRGSGLYSEVEGHVLIKAMIEMMTEVIDRTNAMLARRFSEALFLKYLDR